jgi:predicted nucleic acid-binding protein
VVDAIVLGEVALGILLLPRGRKRARLEQWFEEVADRFACLARDAGVCRRWAQLVADLRKKGLTPPLLDSMIAATALAHGLTVATNNITDIQLAGVPVEDPFG